VIGVEGSLEAVSSAFSVRVKGAGRRVLSEGDWMMVLEGPGVSVVSPGLARGGEPDVEEGGVWRFIEKTIGPRLTSDPLF